MKKHKKNIILFLIIFFVALIMCKVFLQPHYVHDTYKVAYDGYREYSLEWFIKEARPFSAIITLLASVINLPIETYSLISFVLAIAFLSASVLLIYNIFVKKFIDQSKWVKVLVLLISFITIFNYLGIEHILFLECSMLSLGVLLSVIAAKIVIEGKKQAHIKAFLIVTIATFCYQFSAAIFPLIVFANELLFNKKNLKSNIIELTKTTLIYIFSMIINLLYVKILFQNSRIQLNVCTFEINNILNCSYELIINSMGILKPYINLAIFVCTILCIITLYQKNLKEKFIYILKYLLLILASITVCMAPILTGASNILTVRMCIAFGTTIGFSLLTILYIMKGLKKYFYYVVSIPIIAIFLLNFFTYTILTKQHILTNSLDENYCYEIKQMIEEYEKTTGIKVDKIASILRSDKLLYYPNMLHAGTTTQSVLSTWAVNYAISFYLERDLKFISISPNQYIKWWGDKEWDKHSIEQVVIENDVIYFCVY